MTSNKYKVWIPVLLLLVMSTPSKSAQPTDRVDIASSRNKGAWFKTTLGCLVWTYDFSPDPRQAALPHQDLTDTSAVTTWTGDCSDGRVSGTGTLSIKGDFGSYEYRGSFENGVMSGMGFIITPDKRTVSGIFKEGIVSGNVKYTQPNGVEYYGQWMNGEEGWGTALFPDHSIYKGNWHMGVFSGTGRITYPNGAAYSGDFANGKPNGRGTASRAEGDTLAGDWVDGKLVGPVTATNPNGDRFEGSLFQGKKEGDGVYTWSNGSRFQGNWKNNLPSGQGLYTEENGTSHKGTWVDGCLEGSDPPVALFVPTRSCQNLHPTK